MTITSKSEGALTGGDAFDRIAISRSTMLWKHYCINPSCGVCRCMHGFMVKGSASYRKRGLIYTYMYLISCPGLFK